MGFVEHGEYQDNGIPKIEDASALVESNTAQSDER
jgi:hypothetical protein